jgi:hypothetical protein
LYGKERLRHLRQSQSQDLWRGSLNVSSQHNQETFRTKLKDYRYKMLVNEAWSC